MRIRLTLISLAFSVLGLSLLSACAGNIIVTADATVPTPIVDPHPFNVGVYYSPELVEYVHEQKVADRGSITIDLGRNQKTVFDRTFGQMFQEVVHVESLDAIPQNVAGVIVPSIIDVQLMTPRQSRNDYYEIWIRYSIDIILPDGTKLDFASTASRGGREDPEARRTQVAWMIAAYGKANKQDYSSFMEKADSALAEATQNAYRDAALLIVVSLANIADPPRRGDPRIKSAVREWIKENSQP
ncbi:MAG: hypothetical protein OXH84_09260 [Gammaproteobacteria bacterium]|nr:hypothetical protein [Gammaproteobacteria bacterium]